MLEINRIRTDKETIIAGLAKRQIDARPTIEQILEIDAQWRQFKTETDNYSAEINQLSRYLGDL